MHNNAIGYNNSLIYNIPEDLEYFRKITTGGIIIMGRKTYDSLPEKVKNKGLSKRHSIVISNKKIDFVSENFEHAFSLIDALKIVYANYRLRQIYIIGGESIYKQAFKLNCCDTVYLNEVDAGLINPILDYRSFPKKLMLKDFKIKSLNVIKAFDTKSNQSVYLTLKVYAKK